MPTKTSDGLGGFKTVFVTHVSSVPAAIWPVSASEQVQANQTVMTISHRIRIRYRANVRPSWRIKFETRYFNIVSIINPNMENEMLDILCKEAA